MRVYPLIVIVLAAGLSLACGDSGSPASPDAGAAADHAVGLADSAADAPAPDAAGSGDLAPDASSAAVQLPRDEAPHTTPMEWWYYTGVLETDGGQRYGFEYVIFQARMGPIPAWLGHFAVTDEKQGSFKLATQSKIGPLPQSQPGFDLQVGGWKMRGHAGQDKLEANMEGYAIDLSLTAEKPVALQYGDGVMTLSPPEPFYYYSYPRMKASGTLIVDGQSRAVTGKVWMDHQWGELGQGHDGWDWFSLRLDDQTDVMLFLVRKDGQPQFVGGTVIDPAGKTTELKQEDFVVEATGTWTSPHTQGVYPQGWTVKVPSIDLDVTLAPVAADQEFHKTTFGEPVYWEGLCTLTGTRGSHPAAGHAYVELTGYAP